MPSVRTSPPRSIGYLAVGLGLILVVQAVFAVIGPNLPETQVRTKTMGLFPGLAAQFAPFYYHAGQIPVVGPSQTFTSSEGADEYARVNGPDLKMDADLWSREGDLGRIWLYAPWALTGGRGAPSVHLANWLIWSAALSAFFASCWWVGRPVLGSAVSFLLSFSPFYAYAVHGEENLFWLPGATFLIVAALALPIVEGRLRTRAMLAAAAAAGLVVGLGGSMRREVWPIVLVCVAAPWLSGKPVREKLAVSVLPIVMMLGVDAAQVKYFDQKWEEAVTYVSAHGGEPANGQRMTGHTFWHPVWCGLGDFGSDKGYSWSDDAAYQYGFGEIERRYGTKVEYGSDLRLLEHDPPGSSYIRMVGGYPHYEEVLRDGVIKDVKSHPLWFAKVIVLRLNRVLAVSTPFNGIGYLALGCFAWLVAKRRIRDLWLLGGSMAVSFSAVTVYSGDGATWSGLFGVVGLALLAEQADRALSRHRNQRTPAGVTT